MSPRRRIPGPLALAFGRIVKALREEKHLSLTALASRAGMTSERISMLEVGADEPDLMEIFQLDVALDVNASELVTLAVEQGVQL
jgi:transcriptional regulator with XRE-family HTH domain